MPIEIRMPALSPTMTEGNLAKWLKKEGDEVHSGDVLAEIETDKATMEFEAVDEGRLGRILVPEGAQGVKVNEPIALLLREDEDESALPPPAAPAAAVTTPPGRGAEPAPAPSAPPPSAPPPAAAPAPAEPGGRIFASPLARRIVKADIDAALAAAAAPAPIPAPAAEPAAAPPALSRERVAALAGGVPYTLRPLTAMRRTIARRLSEAKQTIPHFYVSIDCELDALLKIREELNAKSPDKISINDLLIRAAALALRQVPAANAAWSEEGILLWERVDIAIAVALEDGLITPIVRAADTKGLAAIARDTKDLIARARAGKLKLEEFQGGTFSISNLGMYGVRDFAAVINPPHGCILAVGAGERRPVVKDGALAVATMMSCTLSCDHRAVDGAVGAQFLAAFKTLIEDPLRMLL